MRRAARWDGVHPGKLTGPMTPQEVRDMVAYIDAHRTVQEPFDVAIAGRTPGDDPVQGAEIVAPFAQAGATWWIEGLGPESTHTPTADDAWPIDEIERRIRQGPPQARTGRLSTPTPAAPG